MSIFGHYSDRNLSFRGVDADQEASSGEVGGEHDRWISALQPIVLRDWWNSNRGVYCQCYTA